MLETFQSLFNTDAAVIAEMSPQMIFASIFVLTFLSEDAACVFAGALAARGRLGLPAAIFACFAGIAAGDIVLYWAGRRFGSRLLYSRWSSAIASRTTINRAGKWLDRNGATAVFASRFVSGLRLPTYLAAGLFRTSFRAFILYFILAAAVWTPFAVSVSYFSSSVSPGKVFFGLIAAFVTIRLLSKFSTYENRRLIYGRIKRIIEWEFWPVQIIYIPVVVYCILLALKFRCLTVFTCANPGMVAGGFAGEAKHDIYKLIEASRTGNRSMLRYLRLSGHLSAQSRSALIEGLMDGSGLSLPLVLKPDIGERGKGVQILRKWEEIEDYLSKTDHDTIAQEYAEGVEVSVFYYRFPGERHGRIFSITEKCFPEVKGDGISDLRRLILNDNRAVALAESYFRQNPDAVDRVPRKGESVSLIEIGTHSLGAIFVDGEWLRTKKLEAAIDAICRDIDGFYFGRFDLRAATFEDFQKGGPFRIIELNGVSSESTNIYDPKFGLFDAYKVLFRQWRLAFEIGEANRKCGVEPTPVRVLMKLALGVKPRNATPRRGLDRQITTVE